MTFTPYRTLGTPQPGGIVLVADHASNAVPEGIELGVAPGVMDEHVAVDIGVDGVAERMARRHGIPAHLATLSRLVIDLHREEDHPGLIPETSDGHLIAGNIGADRQGRIDAFYHPYHDALEAWLEAAQPRLIVSLHSFTPRLETRPEEARPWQVSLLYNQTSNPAFHAMRLFADQGLIVGDNEPYSGRDLNATMNRHAEDKGRDYLAIEVRNDQIADEAGQARWAALIADVAQRTVLAMG
ncbi:N-formylglutamate amidohydrolase [Croceicoccus bisphenolivorans]|uniref:N-formylglutamate amidohydrolase n=1 Tax=Croceicoccus bisphenolivorans TaxID=1783232 RepID=UPI000833D05E|nr:N-formylglutamate amidohydrolase [Croceicoccus bisphenolivorans]